MLAIILSRKNFREYDQIISFYTAEFGKSEAVAKGVKKFTSKQSWHLEPFALAEVEIVAGREINRLVKAQSIEIFKNIRQNLTKSAMAISIIGSVNKLLRTGEKDERIFYLLKTWLEYIEKIDVVNKGLLYGFIVSLFHCLGFAPELDKCVGCGSVIETNFCFNIKNGGLVCRSCDKYSSNIQILSESANIRIKEMCSINLEQVKYLKVLLSGNWQKISKLGDDKNVFNLIYKFCQFHSEIKMINFLNFNNYL